MKIAFIAYFKGTGGTERSLISLLSSLPKDRFEITVIGLGNMGELRREIPEWIKIKIVNVQSNKKYVLDVLKQGQIKKGLKRVVESICEMRYAKRHRICTSSQLKKSMVLYDDCNEEYDIAISWTLPGFSENVYTVEKVSAKRKLMWVHMDMIQSAVPKDGLLIYSKFDEIYCVSQYCKKTFDSRFPECNKKTKVFYNMLDTEDILKKSKVHTDIEEDGTILVTCGRLTAQKQPWLAVNIVLELLKNGITQFKWYFAGDGDLYGEMQSLIKANNISDYIVLLGNQDNPYSIMSRADIYVQLSAHESYCLTLNEAQILGVPTVTTNFPSAFEIADDGLTAYIVENNWKSLYDKIEFLIKNPEARIEMRRLINNRKPKAIGDVNQFFQIVENGILKER